MGSPSGASAKPAPMVDASDRKFYIKAAENGNADALEKFDAALSAQSSSTPPSPPAPSAPTFQPPASLSDQELAQQFAPVLVLPGGEYDLPADPQDFIDNSRWREDRTFWGDSEHGNNIDGDGSNDFTAEQIGQEGTDGQFLDLADNRRDIGSEDAPFFYQVSRSESPDEPTKVTYWFFYPYNDGPGPQNHEGDFERITVEIDPTTGQPRDAIYSAHSNKHTKPTPYDQVEPYIDPETGQNTGRPLVYVASGSHASYPEPGSHRSDAPGAIRIAAGGDAVDDHGVDSFDQAAHVIDTGNNLHDVEAQPWYPSDGGGVHWGEPGNADGLPLWGGSSSGPAGPSEEKQHVELDEGPTSGPPTGTTTTTIPAAGPTTTTPGTGAQEAPSGPTPTTIPSPSPGTTTGG